MEVRRTVPVKLDVADSAALLHETISEFLWAANYVVDHAWQGEYKTTSKAQLQRETYDDVRAGRTRSSRLPTTATTGTTQSSALTSASKTSPSPPRARSGTGQR
jgi:hypothetical protein